MPQSEQANTVLNATRTGKKPVAFWVMVILAQASERAYLAKLRLLSQIHADIAPVINAKRQAARDEFKHLSDKFIPDSEDKGELFRLIIHTREYNEKNRLDFSVDE